MGNYKPGCPMIKCSVCDKPILWASTKEQGLTPPDMDGEQPTVEPGYLALIRNGEAALLTESPLYHDHYPCDIILVNCPHSGIAEYLLAVEEALNAGDVTAALEAVAAAKAWARNAQVPGEREMIS